MRVLVTIFPMTWKASVLASFNLVLAALGMSLNASTYFFLDTQASDINASIKNIIAKHAIIGKKGTVKQWMGGGDTVIKIGGKLIYEVPSTDNFTASFLKNFPPGSNIGWNWARLELFKYLSRESLQVPLILATDEFIGPVYIEDFDYGRAPGMPNVYNWKMTLIEVNPALSVISSLASGSIEVVGNYQNTRGF